VQKSDQAPRHVLLLADESADLKIAGVRQLDRILLALNEYAALRGERIEVSIRWTSGLRPFRADPRWTAIVVKEESPQDRETKVIVLTTRTVFPRFRLAATGTISPEENEFIRDAADIPRIERKLLQQTGKSQDGIVARNFDRHISRALSRVLVRFPISPTQWTIAILPFALAAFAAFIWDGWTGTLIGMLLVEIQSVLDGCDGEIARAKYMESEIGRRLDMLCDVGIEILIALGLGIGLWRHAQSNTVGQLFFFEGLTTAMLIAGREWFLAATSTKGNDESGSTVYRRHAHLVQRSGIFGFGKRLSDFLIQLTKRDVGITFFLLLAVLGQGQWILHILLVVALGSVVAMTNARRLTTGAEA
jgi:phosphatidylglycerophosphate synthase